MVGPKYGFWRASTHEVRNGIEKSCWVSRIYNKECIKEFLMR